MVTTYENWLVSLLILDGVEKFSNSTLNHVYSMIGKSQLQLRNHSDQAPYISWVILNKILSERYAK